MANGTEVWLYFTEAFPGSADAISDQEIDLTGTGIQGQYLIPQKCQVLEWGLIVTTTFSANATDPIVKLTRAPLVSGTPVVIQALTIGNSNTKLRVYTNNPDVVAAGGPGVVTVGPSIGGHTTALAADTALVAGTVVVADTKSMPSAVLSPGDSLYVEITTGATTGGKGVFFVRLQIPSGEPYTTAYVNYDAIP